MEQLNDHCRQFVKDVASIQLRDSALCADGECQAVVMLGEQTMQTCYQDFFQTTEVQAVPTLQEAGNQHELPETAECSKCVGEAIETAEGSMQVDLSFQDEGAQHELPEEQICEKQCGETLEAQDADT